LGKGFRQRSGDRVRFIHVYGLLRAASGPLAMMVSVDRVLIKLPRFEAR
jgi:hypothetical protein